MSDFSCAEPTSLLGGLQRGLGRAYLEAIATPNSAALVVQCIVKDPRWDHQVEDRDWFYASLVDALRIDLEHLRLAYDDAPNDGHGDDAAWLATGVFCLSARRGNPDGLTELLRYLHSERDVHQAIGAILEVADCVDTTDLLQQILEFADTQDMREAIEFRDVNFDSAPWPAWCQQSDVVNAAVQSLSPHDLSNDAVETRITTRLRQSRVALIEAASMADPGTSLGRLSALAQNDENVLLEVGAALLNDPGTDQTVRRLVRWQLGALRSEAAVRWASSIAAEESEAGYVALELLADAGDERHKSQLHHLLVDKLADPEFSNYAVCGLVDALGRLRAESTFDVLLKLYEQATYSYLRRRCVQAMFSIKPVGLDDLAYECLWDCEEETRRLAINYLRVNKTPDVVKRIKEISTDPTEDRKAVNAAIEYLRTPAN